MRKGTSSSGSGDFFSPEKFPLWPKPKSKSDWGWLALAGLLPFCFSPVLQMTGLAASRATDNALIIAMEPMFTVFLAWAFLRERVYGFHLAAFSLAIAGFSMLAGINRQTLTQGFDAQLVGNLILLASLSGEASYTVIGRKLIRYLPPSSIFTAALTIGTLSLTLITCFTSGLPNLSQLTPASLLGVLWLGPLGTGLTYLLWIFALVRVSAAGVAITLFVQPVMGAVLGVVLLREDLTFVQIVGGLTILGAVVGQSLGERRVSRLTP